MINLDYDSERMGPHLQDCLLPQTDYPCQCCQEIACERPCICARLQHHLQRHTGPPVDTTQ